MTSFANGSAEPVSLRSERPRLLPFNRKLRHLHGISIRNLNLGNPEQSSRRKSIDDEAIPFTLRSPTKLLTVSESPFLTSSRSLSDLRAHGTEHTSMKPTEPGMLKSRRTSHSSSSRARPPTLQRSNTSPRQRQQALKDTVTHHVANVFFSLHCHEEKEPIYISEMMTNVMNPDFRSFDLNEIGGPVTRRENLVVRVWAQATDNEQWPLLVELSLSLRSLQYIGNSLEDFHHPMPDNAILFHLSDGIYTSFTDLPVEETSIPAVIPATDKLSAHLEATSSYDALMRLSTLDQCIQDSIATRHKLAADITKLIEDGNLRTTAEEQLAEAKDHLLVIQRTVAAERRQVKATTNKVNELRKTLETRRNALNEGNNAHGRTHSDLTSNLSKIQHCQQTQKNTADAITGQRRRICEDLLSIYPINPTPQRALAFTIRNLALPNSTFTDTKPDVVSAALGHVAHLVYLLSLYLSVPLPYTITPSSSTSSISDPISLMAGSRHFPLYIKGSVFYRFEYGVFLLNKNIELLASHLELKILDIRQTLPNLKYVLFVATAGQGELPARKTGGVRGLLWRERNRGAAGVNVVDGGGDGTPGSSRRGSWDSDVVPTVTGGLRSVSGLKIGG